MSEDKPKLDAKEKALKYGPRNPNKFLIWANRFKKSPDDKQPSLQGYYTDRDMNMFQVAIWKNTSKEGSVYFSGSMTDLVVKQNVQDMPKPKLQKENLDEDIPY
jgi:hypothetical protein